MQDASSWKLAAIGISSIEVLAQPAAVLDLPSVRSRCIAVACGELFVQASRVPSDDFIAVV
jgi:hypothetical protein